jgi:hypothetical protein
MTAQSSPAAQKILEIPIETLPRLYLAVVATSKTPEREWQDLFHQRVEADCVQCGIKVSGDELRDLSIIDPQQPLEDPKLDRLRLKYCARNTCPSRFYRVHIQPDSELHWTAIKEQLQLATPEIREKRERKPIRLPSFFSVPSSRPGILFLCALLCFAVVSFFLVRYWVYGYRIPVIHKKHEYRVIQAPQ